MNGDLFLERYEAARVARLERDPSSLKEFTTGDLMKVIWDADNEDDMRRIFEGHAADIQRQIDAGLWRGREDAATSARMNIGWMFGEGMDPERIAMWKRATGAAHPVLPL